MVTKRLSELGIELSTVSGPFGAYVPAKRSGNLIYVAGQLPMKDGKLIAVGQVPSRCSLDDARTGARQCVINALSAVRTVTDINHVGGVVRVGVFVSSDKGFTQQPQIANAASELIKDIFGELGQHARSAVGVSSLPLDAAVEIEFIFELV